MIWKIIENELTWLEGFLFDFIPENLNSKIKIVKKGSLLGITADGVIGSIALSNGDTLQISPKVGAFNFFRMLLTCEELYSDIIADYISLVNFTSTDLQSPTRLIIPSFVKSLKYLTKQGLLSDRIKVKTKGSFAQGEIELLKTSLNIHRKKYDEIYYSTRKREYDTPENRILSNAAKLVLNQYPNDLNSADLSFIKNWAKRATGKAPQKNDLAEVNTKILRKKYQGSRGYYINALILAKILLTGVGFAQGDYEEIQAGNFLINSSSLFEEYLRKVLIKGLVNKGYFALKGGNPPEFLYTDTSFKLSPDITLYKGTNPALIADAKYKIPDAKDHYQIISYIQSYRVENGVIFFPIYDKGKHSITIKSTNKGLKVYLISLPLMDLDLTEEIVLENIIKILN